MRYLLLSIMSPKPHSNWPPPPSAKRKSTALITLALVPLGLLGLGYVACDREPEQQAFEATEEDFGVERTVPGEPEMRPMLATGANAATQPTGVMGPDGQPYDPNRTYEATPTYAMRQSSFFPMFIPIPMWRVPTYRPIYRPGYTGPRYGNSYSRIYRPSPFSGYRPPIGGGGGYSRSTGGSSPSRSSGYSSGTNRGGFGSSASSSSGSSSS